MLRTHTPSTTENVSLHSAEPFHIYDAFLANFVRGEYGRVDLDVGEVRAEVRRQLQAAAGQRGLAPRFRPDRGPLIFRVEVAPAIVVAPKPTEPVVVKAALVLDHASTQREPALRRPREERRVVRYDDVLPRWMREGQHGGRRGTGKRRGR